jgi:hypothetical protein
VPGQDTLTLCIGIDIARCPPLTAQHVPLVGSIEAAIDATLREWASALERGNAGRPPPEEYREAARGWLPPALSLVLYLCSQAAEISGRAGSPGNPAPRITRRHGARLYPAEGPRQWNVGMRLGAALRAALAAEARGGTTDERQGMRPHIRRAHWHAFLSGPRTAPNRRRELRWMPPIPVALADYDDLPATIHPVGSRP